MDKLCVCVCATRIAALPIKCMNIQELLCVCEPGVFTSVHINLNGNCFFHAVEWKL